jgi:hypothetical protein
MLPPAGVYYPVLLLVEHTASCTSTNGYCTDDYVNLFETSNGSATVTVGSGGGNNTGGSSSLSIVGTYSYSVDSSDTTAQLNVAEILNSSTTYTTGTLRLELWLTTTPYAGGTINGNRIATYQLTGPSQGTLGPNQDFTNISASVPLADLPGPGTYDVTLIVSEYTNNCGTSDGFCIATYGAFPNQFVISDPPSTAGNVSDHSGGGAFGWLEIAALGGLLAFGRGTSRARSATSEETSYATTPLMAARSFSRGETP